MIKKLYECGCFDYKKFILGHSKELMLDANSSVALIHMLDEYKENSSFSMDVIKKKMMVEDDVFDSVITNLLEREYYSVYIQYEDGVGKEAISLDGFFKRVKDILEDVHPMDMKNELFSVTQYIQKEFNRLLTADELEIVSSLITDDRVSKKDIEDAVGYMKEHYKVYSVKNLISSLNRYRKEPENTSMDVPDFVKDFLKAMK